MSNIIVHKRKSYGNMVAVYYTKYEVFKMFNENIANIPLYLCGIYFEAEIDNWN